MPARAARRHADQGNREWRGRERHVGRGGGPPRRGQLLPIGAVPVNQRGHVASRFLGCTPGRSKVVDEEHDGEGNHEDDGKGDESPERLCGVGANGSDLADDGGQ